MKITLICLILIVMLSTYFWRENSNIPKKSVWYVKEMRLFLGISKHCALFINSFSVMIYLIPKQKKSIKKFGKTTWLLIVMAYLDFFYWRITFEWSWFWRRCNWKKSWWCRATWNRFSCDEDAVEIMMGQAWDWPRVKGFSRNANWKKVWLFCCF